MHAPSPSTPDASPASPALLPEPAVPSAGRPGRRWSLLAVGVLALAGLAAGGAYYVFGGPDAAPEYRTSEVTLGDVQRTIATTGTLEAVRAVEVGTQVSGVITELSVDYNDTVTAGQVIARIDPTLLEADVQTARAGLAQRSAEATRARQELDRVQFLASKGAATGSELEAATATSASAASQVASARVALERAERNLAYATITAPIDGVVVDRLVDVGQTVNAGTSAPSLFSLAGDLDELRILATVDEADIGQIAPGQPVEFTVSAFDESFAGTVDQVRLQALNVDSVVTYQVAIDVDASQAKSRLLPGMTADVDIVVDAVEGALTVPAAALRFTPPEGANTASAATPKAGQGSGRGARARGEAGSGREARAARQGGAKRDDVWVLGADQQLVRVPVRVGLDDGRVTAVTPVEGHELGAGAAVITGQVAAATTEAAASSLFSGGSSETAGRPRRGGF